MHIKRQTGPYGQFILFGDSITEQSASQDRGYAFMPALQQAYIRRLDVINRGFSGYTTANAIVVLPDFMPTPQQAKIEFMTIFFGANDACLPGTPGGQHVPLDQYKRNLVDLVNHPSVKSHSPRIILITPPPINEYDCEIDDRANGISVYQRTASTTQKYAIACREVGLILGIPVLDLWSAMMQRAGWEPGSPLPGSKDLPRNNVLTDLLIDGLHFSPNGYKLLFDQVMKTIKSTWPEFVAPGLPMTFPQWKVAPKVTT